MYNVPRLWDLQDIILNLIYAAWALASFVFMLNAFRIGLGWTLSQGDAQKIADSREKIKNIIFSLVIIFGSWLAVTFIVNVIGIQNPDDCFKTPMNKIKFQFVFPDLCTKK